MKRFEGIYTALVTPFENGKIDFLSLEKLIEHQIQNGVSGFVVNGTTAESPTLELEEKVELLQFVKEKVPPSIKIIFGSGSNCTRSSITLSQKAESLGVDGLLVVVPYYNKPSQEGLRSHFTAISESVKSEIILYNVPGRTVTALDYSTIEALSRLENVTSIKEASGDIELDKKIVTQLKENLSCLSGDDGSIVDFFKIPGDGTISVLSHLVPKEMVELWQTSKEGGALDSFRKYSRLNQLIFKEGNPSGVKTALVLMGILKSDEVRLPLVPSTSSLKQEIEEELKRLELIR